MPRPEGGGEVAIFSAKRWDRRNGVDSFLQRGISFSKIRPIRCCGLAANLFHGYSALLQMQLR